MLPDIIDSIHMNITKFWQYGETLANPPTITEPPKQPEPARPQPARVAPPSVQPFASSGSSVANARQKKTPEPTRDAADGFKYALEQEKILKEMLKTKYSEVLSSSLGKPAAWIEELEGYGIDVMDPPFEASDDGEGDGSLTFNASNF